MSDLPAAHVGVSIIHWNQPELVARAVSSVLRSEGVRSTILIVDNGSSPHQTEALVATLAGMSVGCVPVSDASAPDADADTDVAVVQLLRAGRNLGCVGANNLAMSHFFDEVGVEFMFILDPDAEVTPRCLDKLTRSWRPGVGLLGAVILDPDDPEGDRVSFARSSLSWYGWPRSLDRGRSRNGLPTHGAAATELVGGAAMLIPRSVYQRIGPQDARYFFDVDDSEYSLRAMAAGFQNVIVWDAVCWHEMSVSVRGRRALSRYYNLRNSLFLNARYNRGPRRFLFWAALAGRLVKDLAASLRYRDPTRVRAVLAALQDFYTQRGGIGPSFIYE